MIKALRRSCSSSSLVGLINSSAPPQSADQLLGGSCEELGSWQYLVVDIQGIRLRTSPSYSTQVKKSAKDRIRDGSIVEVSSRVSQGLTHWLKLQSGDGWVFDVSPKDGKVRMVEVEVLDGMWEYVTENADIPIINKPTPNHLICAAGNERLQQLATISVDKRVRQLNSKGSFLRLQDGRGWVVDFRRGQQVMRRKTTSKLDETCSSFGATNVSDDSTPSSFASGVNSEAHRFCLGTPENTIKECLFEPEIGQWSYIVLDAGGMTLRTSPAYDQNAKTSMKVHEGDIVKVVERRIGAGTTFLRMEDPPGWVFDVQPSSASVQTGSTRRQRMAEVNVENGSWKYRICASKSVHPRCRCSFDDSLKTGQSLKQGALVSVTQRCAIGGVTFLRLQDGNGWIFDRRNGRVLAEGPLDLQATYEGVTAYMLLKTFLATDPVDAKWAQTQKMLLDGARVQVDLCGEIGRVVWAHVCKPLGMEGWVPGSAIRFENQG